MRPQGGAIESTCVTLDDTEHPPKRRQQTDQPPTERTNRHAPTKSEVGDVRRRMRRVIIAQAAQR